MFWSKNWICEIRFAKTKHHIDAFINMSCRTTPTACPPIETYARRELAFVHILHLVNTWPLWALMVSLFLVLKTRTMVYFVKLSKGTASLDSFIDRYSMLNLFLRNSLRMLNGVCKSTCILTIEGRGFLNRSCHNLVFSIWFSSCCVNLCNALRFSFCEKLLQSYEKFCK